MSEATKRAGGQTAEGSFVRGLGLMDATNIVAGAMIGSGIFVVAQDIAQGVGSPGWMLMVWAVTGVMTVMVSLSYGELAAMYPQAGGQYVYLREAYSPLWGFLYGWTLFMVIQSGSIAAVGVVFAKYLGVLVPGISTSTWLFKLGDITAGSKTIPIGLNTAQAVGILVIALLTANNCINLNAGKWVQNVFTTAKVISLAALIVVGLTCGQAASAFHEPGFFTRRVGEAFGTLPMFAAFWTTMVGSMFASDAWNNVTFVAGEVRNPRRNIPLSLIFGAGGVVFLYFLVNVGYANLLPFQAIASAPEQRVAAAAVGTLVPWGAIAISVVVMVSTFGCLNGMILSGPRLYWAMAKDGLFFSAAGHLGKKSGVPVKGLVLQGVWSAILALSGTYGDLLDYVIFAAMLFYVLTVVGIFVLRRRAPDMERPYKAWGYPVVPILYLAAAVVMMLVLLVYKPLYTWPGVLIVALGVPVYFVWRASKGGRSAKSESTGQAREGPDPTDSRD
ncbi:MAG: amino acid permease [Deltaproteobacteria bacterium]|nr:amino acid permease [Deltaproteobacteria bacterium]